VKTKTGAYLIGSAFFALSAQAGAAEIKFAAVPSYTVIYDVRGAETGTITLHSRKYDTEQVQILALTKNGKTSNTRVVTKNEKIFVHSAGLPVREALNEGYAKLVKAASGKAGNTIPKAMMQSLGFVPTGAQETHAKESCRVWESKTLKQKRCVTEDGIAIKVQINVGGKDMIQTARSIARGNSGPDSAYQVAAAKPATP